MNSPARDLECALRAFSRPWRHRRARENALAVAAIAILFSAALLASATPIAFLVGLGGVATIAFWLVRATSRKHGSEWREIEFHLQSDGALQAAIENATSSPLGALSARRFAQRLKGEVPPQQIAVRPVAWVTLAFALLLLTISAGLLADAAGSVARSSTSPEHLALTAMDAADLARDSAAGSTRDAEATAAVRELREQQARGLLSKEEFAERIQQISKNFARRPAESTIPASSQLASDSSSSSSTASGGTSDSTTDIDQPDVTRSDPLSRAAKSWDELPERYRRHVARYFRRRD